MVNLASFFEIEACSQTVLPDRQVSFNRIKNGGKCQNSKIQMQHFEYFSNIVLSPLGFKPAPFQSIFVKLLGKLPSMISKTCLDTLYNKQL